MLDFLTKPSVTLIVAAATYIVGLAYLCYRVRERDTPAHLRFELILFTLGFVAAALAAAGGFGYESRLAWLQSAWVRAEGTMSANRRHDEAVVDRLNRHERNSEAGFQEALRKSDHQTLEIQIQTHSALQQSQTAATKARAAAKLVSRAEQQALLAEESALATDRRYASLKATLQRHLTPGQSAAFTSAFYGSASTVSIWRCISSESAITLMNDFFAAFQRAHLTFDSGGVSTTCGEGIEVTYNPSDQETLQRLEKALTEAGFRFIGHPDNSLKIGHFSLLIGEKSADSP